MHERPESPTKADAFVHFEPSSGGLLASAGGVHGDREDIIEKQHASKEPKTGDLENRIKGHIPGERHSIKTNPVPDEPAEIMAAKRSTGDRRSPKRQKIQETRSNEEEEEEAFQYYEFQRFIDSFLERAAGERPLRFMASLFEVQLTPYDLICCQT